MSGLKTAGIILLSIGFALMVISLLMNFSSDPNGGANIGAGIVQLGGIALGSVGFVLVVATGIAGLLQRRRS